MKHTIFDRIRRFFKRDELYEYEGYVGKSGREERQNCEIKLFTSYNLVRGFRSKEERKYGGSKYTDDPQMLLQFENGKQIKLSFDVEVKIIEEFVFLSGGGVYSLYDKYGNVVIKNSDFSRSFAKVFSFEDDLMFFDGDDVIHRLTTKSDKVYRRIYSSKSGDLKTTWRSSEVPFTFFDSGRNFLYASGKVFEYEKFKTSFGEFPLVCIDTDGITELLVLKNGECVSASSFEIDKEQELVKVTSSEIGYVDYSGKEVIAQEYSEFTSWSNKRIFGKKSKNGNFVLLSKERKYPVEYEAVLENFSKVNTGAFEVLVAKVKGLDGREQYINVEGEEVKLKA